MLDTQSEPLLRLILEKYLVMKVLYVYDGKSFLWDVSYSLMLTAC